ncbi:hypothetical protein [Arthrobacter sp. W4I7]|uniref:hypothetical protein n=1 Tax=Arthrobacter sp. W4I7 TaxID=3042296 RepID=UPI0027837CBF|nr:hypothetical protein [Arthrobacter sp. W4I7]MDQ0689044.1 hypothetical protein [Arthrobacter sp. W4I7]
MHKRSARAAIEVEATDDPFAGAKPTAALHKEQVSRSVEDVRCQGECLCVVSAAHQVVDKGTQVVTAKVTFVMAQGQRTPSHLFTRAHLPLRAYAVVCEKNSTGAQIGDTGRLSSASF